MLNTELRKKYKADLDHEHIEGLSSQSPTNVSETTNWHRDLSLTRLHNSHDDMYISCQLSGFTYLYIIT